MASTRLGVIADKEEFSLFEHLKKMFSKLNVNHNMANKLALQTAEQIKTRQKFFTTEYKELMKFSLELIKDPNIQNKFKTAFRKILTDLSLSKEKREAKVRFGLTKIAQYLDDHGMTKVADNLLDMLHQARKNKESTVVKQTALLQEHLTKNLSLEYRRANFALAFAEQSKVWQDDSVMPSMTRLESDASATVGKPQIVARASFANTEKPFMPSLRQHFSSQPSLAALAEQRTLSRRQLTDVAMARDHKIIPTSVIEPEHSHCEQSEAIQLCAPRLLRR